MNLVTLSLAYVRFRVLNAALNVVLLALGVAAIVLLLLVGTQLERRMVSDARGIDLVVGAKGSPLQLILSSVYHVDVPTGNVPLAEFERLASDPKVLAAIPVALGDNVGGFRIVGTTAAYLDLYRAELREGRLWRTAHEAVLGSAAARRLGLAPGARFVGSHGLASSAAPHDATPFRVVGVLEPSASVLDNLVLTSLESVWATHGIDSPPPADDPDAQKDAPDEHLDERLEVTAILVRYATPLAAIELPRRINRASALQAAAPALEIARLLSLLGTGFEALRMFGALLIGAAALSVFIALWSGLRERRYDLAVMRTLGARRRTLLIQIVLEGLILAVVGLLLGLALGHGTMAAAPMLIPALEPLGLSGLEVVPGEGWLVVIVLAVGVLAALLPAIQAYRVDILEHLGSRN